MNGDNALTQAALLHEPALNVKARFTQTIVHTTNGDRVSNAEPGTSAKPETRSEHVHNQGTSDSHPFHGKDRGQSAVCAPLQLLLRYGAAPNNTPLLGPSGSCLFAIMYWTQFEPCGCIQMLKQFGAKLPEDLKTFALTGNRMLWRHSASEFKVIILNSGIDIHSVDPLGETTLSYTAQIDLCRQSLDKIQILLSLGCTVRHCESISESYYNRSDNTRWYGAACLVPHEDKCADFETLKQILMLLAAAGVETAILEKTYRAFQEWTLQQDLLMGNTVQSVHDNFLDYHSLKFDGGVPSLQKLCQNTIRKEVLDVNPRYNLFVLVPRLPLPPALKRYLLFNIELKKVPSNKTP